MGKSIKKILGTKVLDPMDVWGTQAEAAQKNANEQAEKDREAMKGAAPGSAPNLGDAEVQAAREAERKRKGALYGSGSTVLTGAGGLSGSNPNGGKTLLGS